MVSVGWSSGVATSYIIGAGLAWNHLAFFGATIPIIQVCTVIILQIFKQSNTHRRPSLFVGVTFSKYPSNSKNSNYEAS